MKIKTERDYVLKIVNYKGNVITQLKAPKSKSGFLKTLTGLARLYERAKKENFLTRQLFAAIKAFAEALYNTRDALYIALKYPLLLRCIKEIMSTKIEDFEEEIVYGKIRIHEDNRCSLCRVPLVYPAYVVFKKNGREVKRSSAIGIKCLNATEKRLADLVEEIKINWDQIDTIRRTDRQITQKCAQCNLF